MTALGEIQDDYQKVRSGATTLPRPVKGSRQADPPPPTDGPTAPIDFAEKLKKYASYAALWYFSKKK
jgi:hypothetical protein